MKRILVTSCLYCAITAVLLGIAYPLLITGIAQLTMQRQANGGMIRADGALVGSQLIGQAFTGAAWFHSRPSAAGNGYDATASSGSNYGPTNKALVQRVDASVKSESTGAPVPIDLVTSSGSGLDPDITPAAALYQVQRVAAARGLTAQQVQTLVEQHTQGRQWGLFGEPRVNVLELNLALQKLHPAP